MFQREYPPEALPTFTREVEALGLDELWVVEDCFYAGGIAQAATALAHSETIKTGLGIMPSVARNPAFTALEVASLARIAPGRFIAGIGHGLTEWMKQIGAFPASQLAALAEAALAVKGILSGAPYSLDGRWAHLDAVKLFHPVAVTPPILLGVRNEKSLRVAGRVADGAILAEGCSPAYVRWAREHLQSGREEVGRTDSIHTTVYIYWSMDDDSAAAELRVREKLAGTMASGRKDIYQEAMGISDAVQALMAEGGEAALRDSMPPEWLRSMAVFGTPEACARTLDDLDAAGANSIVLVPLMDNESALKQHLPRLLSHLGR
jgi:alkanesulfonate monooxygenase SsuD/methylene tetrahydromethanopterin reductase-like flavin-dependent oxidoreductase (luciferase family)